MAIVCLEYKRGKEPLSIHIVWGVILVAAALGSQFSVLPECPFHRILGIPCLSCGSGRALDSICRGDIFQAISLNPLLVLSGMALFFFSLWKFAEHIFSFSVKVVATKRAALWIRISVMILIAADWLYLIAGER